jgi:hypothetical protein
VGLGKQYEKRLTSKKMERWYADEKGMSSLWCCF